MRPKGHEVLGASPVADPMPLTHAQAAPRLRALAPDAFGRDAMGCMDYVRERFPEYIREDKLPEVAAELLTRFAPPVPGRILSLEHNARRAGGTP
jgi:hypothetical protein